MDAVSLLAIGPEIIMVLGAVFVLTVEVSMRSGHRSWAPIAGVAYVAALAVSVVQWLRVSDQGPSLHFAAGLDGGLGPMVVLDGFSAFAGMAVFAVTGLALAGGWDLVRSQQTRGAELLALVMLSTAGMHLMASASNLVMLFLGLEIASISLYIVAGFTRERIDADEAAMKYFLLGSFASAVFLYGVALIFAATGSTFISGTGSISEFLSVNVVLSPGILLAGIALVVVGLGFKISAAPFHMWAPDVYQGAPTGAVALMSAGIKIAAFAAIARVLTDAVPAFRDDWAPAIAVIAAVSAIVGTSLAIAQTDLKRMLAYSSVAHAGFILTGLVAGVEGVPSMWFYVATYAFQLVGAFTVATVVSGSEGGASALSEYTGLSKRSPILAATMGLMMLAMGGIPLTAGFVGKAAVFTSAIDAGYLWLAVVGLVASVAGLFFYLRVMVLMYMQQPVPVPGPGADVATPEPDRTARTVLGVATAVTLVFGIVPWPLLNLVRDALPL